MHIERVRVLPVRARRVYKTQIAVADAVEESLCYILRIETTDGHWGIGEISDAPDSYPDLDEIQVMLETVLVGQDPYRFEELGDVIHAGRLVKAGVLPPQYTGSRIGLIRCAVEMALLDLAGRIAKRPVHDLFGARRREAVRVSWVAFIRDAASLGPEIQERLDQGFDAFKLKVGLDIDEDVRRVALFREVAGDRPHLKIDANGAWTADEAIENLRRLERYGIAGVETPVPRDDIEGMARVRRESGIPLIEHVNDLSYALSLLRADAVDVFNIATVSSGGIAPARRVAALAAGAGVPVLLGSTVELGVGTAAQLHLAASIEGVEWPSDLVGPLLYTDDVIAEPWEWDDGWLHVPKGPGLGVSLKGSLSEALEE